ncbi:MAG TPA: TSUP family transporter [Rhabdaerophilum sp.]|nr:TSUP family transporter [Rhabdaerophilum sp.]
MPEFQLALDLVALLVLAAFAAGFVDAIAGGGGLITVPALLLAGVPPVSAIATNKLQGTFGVASSSFAFWRAGRIERQYLIPFFLAAFAGGVAGAAVAHLVPDPVLRVAIPVALVAIAIFVLLSPKLGDADAKPRMGITAFALTFGLGNGAYDGAFGPGAGTFYLLGLILLCGFAMMRAVAHTRLMNFGSNLGSLLFFLYAGHVLIPLGLAMGFASACGAYLGARTTMRFGAGLIRPLVVIVSLAMAFRLLIDPSNPLGAWLRGL